MPRSHLGPVARFLFFSRWLQLPLYLGLIVAQAVYVWYFMVELTHLVEAAFGSQSALELILKNVTSVGAEIVKAPPETLVMLVVLGLIDVVMISNLLIMVIVGGYETFVSRMGLAVAAVDRIMPQGRPHAARAGVVADGDRGAH